MPDAYACVYCQRSAGNVIEVRYARTIEVPGSTQIAEADLPREIIGRGYYICDDCLRLLDFHAEQVLDLPKLTLYYLSIGVYQLFVVWMILAVGSLAGTMELLRSPFFLATGVVAVALTVAVWGARVSVQARYFLDWQKARRKLKQRKQLFTPSNTLAALTDLRDRCNPELQAYLPVRFEDSERLAAREGSPAVRCLGPSGEPWGEGPQRNFPGSGSNEWYRLIWYSWQVWPIAGVVPPPEWERPPTPPFSEAEVGGAAFLSAFGAGVTLVAGEGTFGVAMVVGLALAPAGFFIGRIVQRGLRSRREQRWLEG